MQNQIWSTSDVERTLSNQIRLFALNGTAELGGDIAKSLGHPLSAHEEREFEDGEHKARPLDPVAGTDVFVIHSLHGGPTQSANDKLCRMLFFIGALRDAGAKRVTAVAPYLCYARKDRRTKSNDPVTTRYVAALFEAIGCDALVTLEVHNEAAFENAFRCRAVALTAAALLIDASKAFAEKRRSAGVVSGDLFVGDVADATCVIVDDLISTGGTLVRAAHAARARGARRVLACVAHGLFMPGAETALADPAIDRIIATDSVPAFRLRPGPVRDKLEVVSAAPLLAEAIRRLHENKPLSDL